ncbi:hypothetical protein, partial [Staphylococcus aureus]|uniref:hypothetical protein n=1 Tax=Staphylococcus aureus TaxID=1280 RepID=UPI0038B3EF53
LSLLQGWLTRVYHARIFGLFHPQQQNILPPHTVALEPNKTKWNRQTALTQYYFFSFILDISYE